MFSKFWGLLRISELYFRMDFIPLSVSSMMQWLDDFFSLLYFWPTSKIAKSCLLRGHSTTTWTKFNPILTPSPLAWTNRVILKNYYLSFIMWPPVDFLLTPSSPLIVHVVIECPLICTWLNKNIKCQTCEHSLKMYWSNSSKDNQLIFTKEIWRIYWFN